jgi:hypothetical protein
VDRRFFLSGLAMGLLLLLPGCDSSGGLKLARAKGQVNYKGSPLKGASVKFYNDNGPMAIGTTDDNGQFTLTTNGRAGAMVGKHKVAITKMAAGAAPAMTAPTPDDMMNMQKANMNKPSGPKSEIPETYASPDSSKLTAEVSANASENDFLFELQ